MKSRDDCGICHTVEEKPRKKPQPGKLTQPGSNPGPLGERQRYYPLTTEVVGMVVFSAAVFCIISFLLSKWYSFNVILNFGNDQKSQKKPCLESRDVGQWLEFHVFTKEVGKVAMIVLEHCHDAIASFSLSRVLVFCAKLHYGVGGEFVDNTLLHSLSDFSLSQQQVYFSLWPPRTLVTLHWSAAIFESVEPLLNLAS